MNCALFLLASLQAAPVTAQAPTADTLPLRPDAAAMATAYEDAATRELVRLARGQRDALDASVFHYTARVQQRISVGIRALRRDRLLFRRETASFLEWWRDRPSRIVVLGAREAVPVAISGLQVPDDLEDWVREFLPQPGDDRIPIAPSEDGFAWHPLVEGGEALYRYETGDTTILRLPDGDEIRLVELRVIPRERDFRVVTGSFWIELEDHAVVQAVFRPARNFDLERDAAAFGEEGEIDEVPGILRPVQLDIEYVTMEYGLWELRWWMPRLMAFQGVMRMGAVRVPVTLEVVYSEYTVEADRYGLPELPPVVRKLEGDPYARERRDEFRVHVVIPDDTAALLDSDALAAAFFGQGEALISEGELRQLGERIDLLPAPPLEMRKPRVTPPWALGKGLLRYNRVEGLSAGVRVNWDLTRIHADLTARIGIGDEVPRLEAGVDLPGRHRTWRGAGYWRRLTPMNPAVRPLALGNSVTALTVGRDDGMYFEASGAELILSPPEGTGRYQIRLYAERQDAVDPSTDFSVWAPEGGFRDNAAAAEADQVGLSARYRLARGLDPAGYRWGTWIDLTAETGDFTFVRPSLGLRGAGPLVGALLGAVEVEGGTSFVRAGDLPVQGLWYLGGPATLRGFPGAYLAGPDHSRARAELSTRFPAARVALFADAGWAGRFDEADTSDAAVAVGVGGSLLDGLVRIDLARTLRPVEHWRLDAYLDALF